MWETKGGADGGTRAQTHRKTEPGSGAAIRAALPGPSVVVVAGGAVQEEGTLGQLRAEGILAQTLLWFVGRWSEGAEIVGRAP